MHSWLSTMKYIPTLGLTFLYQPPGQERFYAINKQCLPLGNSGTLAQVVYSCFGDKKERETSLHRSGKLNTRALIQEIDD